jgi:hypothetical protein
VVVELSNRVKMEKNSNIGHALPMAVEIDDHGYSMGFLNGINAKTTAGI